MAPPFHVALTGNPNCGKTTVFNALTGLRAKVANYAGVTVERKEGLLRDAGVREVRLLDLPGTYSLSPRSLDERVALDVLLHHLGDDLAAPHLVVLVVDASNLERNLFYATQVLELGYPTVVALNMMDVAEELGRKVDAAALSHELGVPVVPLVASRGQGMAELHRAILNAHDSPATVAPANFAALPPHFESEISQVWLALKSQPPARPTTRSEALLVLADESFLPSHAALYPKELSADIAAARQRMEAAGIPWRTAAVESRYARIGAIAHKVVSETPDPGPTTSDKMDAVLTHKFWGPVIFFALMALMFQGIFSFAQYPMTLIETAIGWLGGEVERALPPGEFTDLLVSGVIGGVGAVVVFLPQICLLFLFISLLEDSGYMARAAFLMDRVMSKVGLHGKSFIPMLSSFACAIPGIMAARIIESPKDRLATILIAPLMSCSARLPVYTVLIAACLPDVRWGGVLGLHGLAMLGMYLLGIVGALAVAWVFKKTLLKGQAPLMIMELPTYKRPVLSVTLRHMWDRSQLFLRRAGTIILGINILLWFLATHPRYELGHLNKAKAEVILETFPGTADFEAKIDELRKKYVGHASSVTNAETQAWRRIVDIEQEQQGERLRLSYAGRLGHLIEPVIAPLGFDWKMGIGIVASFAAREVFVSTMSVVYNVGETDDSDAGVASLAQVLRSEKRDDGQPAYTPLVGVTLMVFYVFALQCVSTIAIVRRETNSWKWPLFQLLYMTALAWVMAFITYQGGRLLGWPA